MIHFESVSAVRGDTAVLRNLTLDVAEGQTLALVGRSGAGKSSVLKLINRMLRPSSGRIVVAGRDTADWEITALRRQTGYVLQEVGLFPHMTVAGNVGIVPSLLGWTRDRIEARSRALLELVGLPTGTYAQRWPDELSGGQRQRVGIARALAADPVLLLMDEPFGALDPLTRAEMHDVVRRVQQAARKTIVLVTHDLREALTLADRVGVLDAGHLVVCDTPARVRASEAPLVRQLLDASGIGDPAPAEVLPAGATHRGPES